MLTLHLVVLGLSSRPFSHLSMGLKSYRVSRRPLMYQKRSWNRLITCPQFLSLHDISKLHPVKYGIWLHALNLFCVEHENGSIPHSVNANFRLFIALHRYEIHMSHSRYCLSNMALPSKNSFSEKIRRGLGSKSKSQIEAQPDFSLIDTHIRYSTVYLPIYTETFKRLIYIFSIYLASRQDEKSRTRCSVCL